MSSSWLVCGRRRVVWPEGKPGDQQRGQAFSWGEGQGGWPRHGWKEDRKKGAAFPGWGPLYRAATKDAMQLSWKAV